jgi:transposase
MPYHLACNCTSGASGLKCRWQGVCGLGASARRLAPGDPAMAYPYRVVLTAAQRAELRGLVGAGVAPARLLTRARILLKADHGEGGPGWSDAAIAAALDVNASTVLRVRRQFVAEGLAATLARKRPDRVYERRLDGAQEAKLVAVACSAPPDGHAQWSLRLLADELVRLEVVEAVSHETVRQTLKKTTSSRT